MLNYLILLLSYTENTEEQQVLADLYLKYRSALAKYLTKYLHTNSDDVEDCVQQCYLNIARNIETIAKMDARRQLAYLLTAARTTAQRFLIKERMIPLTELDEEALDNYVYNNYHYAAPSAESVTMEREMLRQFHERLSELTPTEQIVFQLYILGETDRDTLARQLGISPNSVRAYISRTTRHALQILKEVCSLE